MSVAPAHYSDLNSPNDLTGPAALNAPTPLAGLADPTDRAWLGEHAASRLPREVQLHADGPLAGTVLAEAARLRALAEGTAGSLNLYDLAAARDTGMNAALLEQLATAGPEAYAVRADGERLAVIAGGDRGLLHGFYAVVLGQVPAASANLFSLGRLAWDPELPPTQILQEWTGATFGVDPLVNEVLEDLLGESWLLYESYTAPLGVGFMVRPGHHYGPDVDGYEYTPWGTYHFADRDGLGVDRTVATGTGFAGLFPEPWASLYESPQSCPDELLLFFHHVPYTHRLHSGKTVIQHIFDSRADGYERVLQLRPRWRELAGRVPAALHERVAALLREQERSAEEWRDQLRTYFFRASGILDASGRPIY